MYLYIPSFKSYTDAFKLFNRFCRPPKDLKIYIEKFEFFKGYPSTEEMSNNQNLRNIANCEYYHVFFKYTEQSIKSPEFGYVCVMRYDGFLWDYHHFRLYVGMFDHLGELQPIVINKDGSIQYITDEEIPMNKYHKNQIYTLLDE
ncbi:hypothetical protein TVAG_009700 [Trichomonas vaginalis G3]|uniref:Uncharacterized protein n=1 Tax=Trichomonas vaginalis (strain ATCC PRA-98 / G3) TaxID=412133 RepID=A2ET46_TRIV3|nr:hypothetical protein TVAGG3_0468140 [Trichomonas vaginalis G3]EAY04162.1 hypothetical protein TVAG_009700 [Trichomonas vaginalis G3]KAI5514876.1 hypothetical protein TVAGG3_0468140 [Trichomonas vaginalis G3]|eukprot:XP_001316385.1 hypothetical protein [Trichomonas vaginalis G3]